MITFGQFTCGGSRLQRRRTDQVFFKGQWYVATFALITHCSGESVLFITTGSSPVIESPEQFPSYEKDEKAR